MTAAAALGLSFEFRPRYSCVGKVAEFDFAANRVHQKSAFNQRRFIRAVEQPIPLSVLKELRALEPVKISVPLAVHRISLLL
jgi:hypothetical protein